MKMILNSRIIICGLIYLLLNSSGCSKVVEPEIVDTDFFIHGYSAEYNQFSHYIMPLQDGNYAILGNEDATGTGDKFALISVVVNDKGELLSRKILADSILAPQITTLDDGSVIFNSIQLNNVFGKLRPDGSLEFATNFSSSNRQLNTAPIETGDGKYYLTTSCNGGSQGIPSNNRVYGFDKSGKYLGYFEIKDSTVRTKCIWFQVYRCDTLGDYYAHGWGFPNWQGNWDAQYQIFVTHQRYDPDLKLHYNKKYAIPFANDGFRNTDYFSYYSSDNYLLIAAIQTSKNENKRGVIYQFDDDLSLIWERRLEIGSHSTNIENITETPDKHYLVFGNVVNVNKGYPQPFAAKLNRDGQVVWSKVYSMNGAIKHGIENVKGNTLLVGHTRQFGNGATGADMYLLKTDKKGNLY